MPDSAKRFLLLCAFAALTLSGAANAQGVRIGNASSAPVSAATLLSTKVLVPVPSAVVQFCLAPASGVPCVNKATTYTDSTLLTPCATSTQVVLDGTTSCVAATDSLGNWGVWVPAGVQYAYTFTSTAGNFGPYYVTGTLVSGVQYSGSILATQVPFGTALNTVTGSPNFTWDNVNKSLTATNSGLGGNAPIYGIATGVTVSASGIVGNCQQLANSACNGGQFTAGDSGAGPIGSVVGISGVPSHLATGTLGTLTGLDLNATVGVGAGAITTSRGIHVGGATFPTGTSPVTHSGIVIDDQCAGGFPATTCSGLNIAAQGNGKSAAVFASPVSINSNLTVTGVETVKNENQVRFADQFTATTVSAPTTTPGLASIATTGSVAANNYKCEVTYNGATAGETTASPASASVTVTGATSVLYCAPNDAPAGALTYNVYWQTAGAGNYFKGNAGIAFGVTDAQTTTPPTSGLTPPVSNTATGIIAGAQADLGGNAGAYIVPSNLTSASGNPGDAALNQIVEDFRSGSISMRCGLPPAYNTESGSTMNNCLFVDVRPPVLGNRQEANAIQASIEFGTPTWGNTNAISAAAAGVFGAYRFGTRTELAAGMAVLNFCGNQNAGCEGAEVDVNNASGSDAVTVNGGTGINLFSVGANKAFAAITIGCGGVCSAANQWANSLITSADGATVNALNFGAAGTGASQNSQSILLKSFDAGAVGRTGFIQQTQFSDFLFAPYSGRLLVQNNSTASQVGLLDFSTNTGLRTYTWVDASGKVALNPPPVAGTTDLGTTALPFGNLWLGTAATNNFKFQPAATAAARVISIPDPLAAENLALIDTMTVNFIPKAASSSTSRLSPTLESDDGTTMTYTGTGGYSAPRLISTVATGTAPLTVTSTTAVANLKVQNLSAVSGGDLPSAAGGTDVGSTALPYGNLWLGTAATNNFKFQPAATSGARIITMADPLSPTTVALPYVIANGTATFSTSTVATGACSATVTVAATGGLTTDSIETAYATVPAGTANADGLLVLSKWMTAGNVNFERCNPTAGTLTPSAIVLNWRVIR